MIVVRKEMTSNLRTNQIFSQTLPESREKAPSIFASNYSDASPGGSGPPAPLGGQRSHDKTDTVAPGQHCWACCCLATHMSHDPRD